MPWLQKVKDHCILSSMTGEGYANRWDLSWRLQSNVSVHPQEIKYIQILFPLLQIPRYTTGFTKIAHATEVSCDGTLPQGGRKPTSMKAIFKGIKTGWRTFKWHLAIEPTKNLVLVKQHRKMEKGTLSQNISQINNRLLGNKLMKAVQFSS